MYLYFVDKFKIAVLPHLKFRVYFTFYLLYLFVCYSLSITEIQKKSLLLLNNCSSYLCINIYSFTVNFLILINFCPGIFDFS